MKEEYYTIEVKGNPSYWYQRLWRLLSNPFTYVFGGVWRI